MTNRAAPEFIPIDEYDHLRRQREARGGDRAGANPHGICTIDPVKWDGVPVPERRWIVPDLIPEGNVTLLSGDGGVGKSQLTLQLLVSAALGKPWLGRPVRRCKCIGVFCEDDEEELQRRLDRILAAHGATFADLEDLFLVCRVGEDNGLMEFHDQWSGGRVTGFYRSLRQHVLDHGCEVLVLDSLHDLFVGNENSRPQARQFIGALRAIAKEMGGAVIVTAHPSLSGRTSGTGEAGTTAWHNAVRSRLYLNRPKQNDDGESIGEYRELKTMKANYAESGGATRLQWVDGVFVVQANEGAPVNTVDRIDLDNRALAEMRAMIAGGAELAADPSARTAFVNVVRKRPGFQLFKQPTLIACQERLLASNRAKLVTMGPPSKSRRYVRPADVRYSGERQ